MEKRSVNLSALLGLYGAVKGARWGWNNEYKTTLQRLANTARGARSGFFSGLDFLERSFGPYASHLIAGQARRIASNPASSNLARGLAGKIGAGRARLANKFQAYVNPANPKTAMDYGRKTAYQLAQAFVPGADLVGVMLHRVDPSSRRVLSSIFDAPKPDYTGQLNMMGARISNAANKYIQGINSF